LKCIVKPSREPNAFMWSPPPAAEPASTIPKTPEAKQPSPKPTYHDQHRQQQNRHPRHGETREDPRQERSLGVPRKWLHHHPLPRHLCLCRRPLYPPLTSPTDCRHVTNTRLETRGRHRRSLQRLPPREKPLPPEVKTAPCETMLGSLGDVCQIPPCKGISN
jgi:hypothetical protein